MNFNKNVIIAWVTWFVFILFLFFGESWTTKSESKFSINIEWKNWISFSDFSGNIWDKFVDVRWLYINQNENIIWILSQNNFDEILNSLNEKWYYYMNLNKKTNNKQKEDNTGENKSIIVDITYSYMWWNLDKKLPDQRIEKLKYMIRNNFIVNKNDTIYLWFLGSEWYLEKKPEINKDIYKINMKNYNEVDSIKFEKWSSSVIDFNKKLIKFYFEKVNIYNTKEITSNWSIIPQSYCEYIIDKEYNCYWWEWLSELISKLYEDKYKWEKYAYWTFLIDYLNLNDIYEHGDVYIFSDWEFQLTDYSNKKYLSKLNSDFNIWKLQDYNWEYYVNNSWFGDYRSYAAGQLKEMIQCKDYKNDIYFVWMNNTDNIPFINYSKWFYKKLFYGCNVAFD